MANNGVVYNCSANVLITTGCFKKEKTRGKKPHQSPVSTMPILGVDLLV